MTVNTMVSDGTKTVTVFGEINTLTTPELAKYMADLQGISRLIIDMENVSYISSAGLRLFLSSLRTVSAAGGEFLVRNCSEFVMEIFESVGYHRILHLERKQ